MVNYARMEEVHRSYGPMEPISPDVRPRQRRPSPVLMGIAAVCLVGAGAGLWLRAGGPAEPSSAGVAPAPASARAETTGRDDRDRALAEAAELQEALRVAVADEASPPEMSPVLPPSQSPDAASVQVAPPLPLRPATSAPPAQQPLRARLPVQASPVQRAPVQRFTPPSQIQPPAPRAAPAETRFFARPDAPVLPSVPQPPRQLAVAPPPQPTVALPVVEASPGPSFDCARARTGAERLVCDRPELATLDRRLAAELEGAAAAGHNPAELQRDQADWRRRREAAAPDPRAVADSYQRRIGQLRSMQ